MATSEIFMLLALVSTGIFLFQFVISIFFGGLDIDVDGDTNVDFDLGSLFSFKGLIHFLGQRCCSSATHGIRTHWLWW